MDEQQHLALKPELGGETGTRGETRTRLVYDSSCALLVLHVMLILHPRAELALRLIDQVA